MNSLKALQKKSKKNDHTGHIASMNEDIDHIASMVLCNLCELYGVHKTKEVSDFVIKFLNYVRKNLFDGNKYYTITTKGEQ